MRASPGVNFSVYFLIRWAVCILQALSLQTGLRFADILAGLIYRINRRHRKIAAENIERAYPETWSDRELDEQVREVYRHYCRVLIEIVHLPRILRTHNWRKYMRIEGGDRIVEMLLSGRPLLVVTGHLGNWEMAGYAMAMFGFKSYAVARPLDNPYLDQYLRKFRERTGQEILAKKGELDRMESILKSGGIVCTLADQDAGRKGMFVDFFGRPASTHKAIALLAIQHNVPLAVAAAVRIKEPLQYAIRFADFIQPEDYAERPDALRYVTQRFTTGLEKLVRTAPEQYLWLHRRWKSEPPRRKKS